MERKRVVAGSLRSVGYDQARRALEVELANGDILEYPGVNPEMARRMMDGASAWSYYRDNIEDEITPRRIGRSRPAGGGENPFE